MTFLRIAIVMFFFFGQIQGKKYVEKLARNGERQHPGHSKAYKSNAPQPHLMKPINHLKQTIHQIPIYVGPPQKGLRLRKAIDPSQNFPVQAIGPHYAAYGNPEARPYYYTILKAVPTSTESYVPSVTVSTHLPHEHTETPKRYKYGYRVSDSHSGTEFGHSEVHDGHTARGYYHVLLPDGRIQTVKYWAGDSGYNAVVSYDH